MKAAGVSKDTRASGVSPSVQRKWLEAWRRSCSVSAPPRDGRLSQSTMRSRCEAGISARQEAAFQSWWREGRSQSMQPRDASLPTAAQRLAGLRNRLASRQAQCL